MGWMWLFIELRLCLRGFSQFDFDILELRKLIISHTQRGSSINIFVNIINKLPKTSKKLFITQHYVDSSHQRTAKLMSEKDKRRQKVPQSNKLPIKRRKTLLTLTMQFLINRSVFFQSKKSLSSKSQENLATSTVADVCKLIFYSENFVRDEKLRYLSFENFSFLFYEYKTGRRKEKLGKHFPTVCFPPAKI